MLPLTELRRWCMAGRSRTARGLRGAMALWFASAAVLVLVSSVFRPANADTTVSEPSGTTRLGAIRFVVALSTPTPEVTGSFEVWIDGRRRINGLAANVVTPYVLVGSGARGIEIRQDGSVLVGESRTIEGGSSTTFVAAHGSGPSRLLGVPDSKSRETPTVRMINATRMTHTLQASGKVISVAPFASSTPIVIPGAGQVPLQFEGAALTFNEKVGRAVDRGSRLLIVSAATNGSSGYAAWSFPSTRYPASLLPVDEGGPVSAADSSGRPPEFWIRRLLAALVLVLVVAATLSTLKSFRDQSLHSRVRARME